MCRACRRSISSMRAWCAGRSSTDRKSTRLNSSHTEIYTLSLHDALPISFMDNEALDMLLTRDVPCVPALYFEYASVVRGPEFNRSEEHTSELQSHRDLHSFPTRRSSDLIHGQRGTRYAADPRCAVRAGALFRVCERGARAGVQ